MSILEGKGISGGVERISEVSYNLVYLRPSCITHLVSRTTSQHLSVTGEGGGHYFTTLFYPSF